MGSLLGCSPVESSRRGSPADLDERLLRFRNRPDEEDASGLAEALLDARRSAEAMEVLDAAMAGAADDPHLLLLTGRAWLGEGDLLRAQQVLLRAARGLPQSAAPLRWLGEVLLKRGDPDRAEKVLGKAVQLAPGDAHVAKLRERAGRLARVAASAGDEPASPPAPEVPAAPPKPAVPAAPPKRAVPAAPPKPAVPAPPPKPAVPVRPAAGGRPSAPTPAVPPPATPRAPVVPDFELDEDEATRVADGVGSPSDFADFETDDSTVVASDISAELAQATRAQDAPAPAPPASPPKPPRPPPPVLQDPPPEDSQPDAAWTSAADEPTAFGDLDELRSTGAPPAPAPAPPSPAPPHGGDEADRVVEVAAQRGLLEADDGTPLEWASRKESRRPGTRVGWTMLALWVLVMGLAVGGYYGYEHWVEQRAGDAARAIAEAERLVLAGDHPQLVAAEAQLRRARDMDPQNARGPAVLLGLQMQRALEDGAFEPGSLRPAVARAERLGVAEAEVEAARAVLAVAGGDPEQARDAVHALRDAHADDAMLQYVAGRLLVRLGDHEQGIAALDRALEVEPGLNAARIALAETYADTAQPELAKDAASKVVERSGEHLRARLWLAFLAAGSDDAAAAGSTLDELAPGAQEGAVTDRVLLHLARSRVLERQGDLDRAAEAVGQAADAGATAPGLLARVADRAASLGRLGLAQQAASLAVQGAPSHAAHRKRLAGILVMRRDGVGALRALSPLSEDDPDVLALSARAALLVGVEETLRMASEKLGEHLERDADASPVLAALHLRTRLALGENGRLWAEARRLLRRAPEEREAMLVVADVALASRNPEAALEALEGTLEAHPQDAEALYLRARAHRMAGDGEAARQDLERTLELAPEHGEARLRLGYLLLDQGRYEQAAELYGRLIERGRGDEVLMGRLGRAEALAARGEAAEAAELLDAVPEAQRDTPGYRIAAARVAFAERRGGEAVKHLRPLATDDGATADVIALYGDALYEAGDVNAAMKQFERALEQDAAHPEALVGQARVMVRASKPKKALEVLAEAELSLQARVRPPVLRARMLTYRGQALVQRGDREAARRALREATAIEGVPAEAHFFLGESLAGVHAPEARQAYETYLEREPKGPYALRAKRALN
jgi:tetratricopeptide (TPR) repeat protein